MPPFQRRPDFDASKDFVCLTFFRAAGYPWERGAPFDKSAVDARTLEKLYDAHQIGYRNMTAEQVASDLAPVTVVDSGDGTFAVNAPWLESPEKVAGHDNAILRAQAIRDAGEPAEHHGVALLPTGGGWYAVNAAWLEAPEKIQGEDKATERATELRKNGPPKEWTAPDMLKGSDSFEPSYEIGGKTVTLGDIVASSQASSGHDVATWNAMDQSMRDGLIKAEIDRLQADASVVEEQTAAPVDGEAAGAGAGGAS